MLFGYVLPDGYVTASHGGPFTLLSANYQSLVDGSPGVKTLFKQTTSGSQTLFLNFAFTTNFQSEMAGLPPLFAQPYPYLLLGVVNIGLRADDGYGSFQATPNVTYTLNGKWAGGGVKAAPAIIGASGYAASWALVRKAEQTSGTTSTLQVSITGNFYSYDNFGIGEVVIVPCDLLPINSVKVAMGGGGQQNRSSGNVGWPVLRRGFRMVNGVLAPKSRADSFLDKPSSVSQSRTLQDMFLRAAGTGSCVIAPYWRKPGTTGPDLPTLARNAMMARMISPLPDISGTASEDQYHGSLMFEELL